MHASICFVFVLCCAVFAMHTTLFFSSFIVCLPSTTSVFEKAANLHQSDGVATNGGIIRWMKSAKIPFEVEILQGDHLQLPFFKYFEIGFKFMKPPKPRDKNNP